MLRTFLRRIFSAGPATATSALEVADRLIADGRSAEDAGNLEVASARYREAAAVAPDYPAPHINLGVCMERRGDRDGAAQSYEDALAIDPSNAAAHYNLGKLCFHRNALAQAERHLRAALERKREFVEARIVLAHVLDAQGDILGSADSFKAAIQLQPHDFGAWFGYGRVLQRLNRSAQAESAFQNAASIDPANADAHGALFDLLQARGDWAEAIRHLEAVLERRPDSIDALYNLAIAFMRMERLEEAEAGFRRVIAREPHHSQAYRMLCSVLHRRGSIEEVVQLCRAAQLSDPARLDVVSFELFALNFVDEVSPEDLFARHKVFGARLEQSVPQRFVHLNRNRDPDRALRIGYVSGDLCFHPVSAFLIPLLDQRDRAHYGAYCYSVGTAVDAMTRRVREVADVWRDAGSMAETRLADVIYGDEIDILIDLSGHSGVSRLGVFAQQPAPVQAAWLGYLNTTGLSRIQYRISDSYCDPPGIAESLHTEVLMRLPHAQWCYRPMVSLDIDQVAVRDVNRPPTFGVFTQIAKMTIAMQSLWARILSETPGSRLVVAGCVDKRAPATLLAALAQHGIDLSRLTLLPFLPVQEYFRSFDDVDIALDTSPYSGGTTTCDALWMGVPVLTLPGVRTTSRSAASILSTLGLHEWIAKSRDDYLVRAVRFGGDRNLLLDLRHSLRERMRGSPLMDEVRFARDTEGLYRAMWKRWCLGEGT